MLSNPNLWYKASQTGRLVHMQCDAWMSGYWNLNFPNSSLLLPCEAAREAPKFVLVLRYQSFCRFCVFQMSFGIISHHLSLSMAARKCKRASVVWKGRTPDGSMKTLSHPAAPSPLTTPLTLMKPSQVVCSGCRSEDSPLSLDVLFPGESCRLHVCFPSTLKGHIHLRPRGEREHGIWKYAGHGGQRYFETKCPFGMCRQARVVLALWFIYSFFVKGTCIPRITRCGSEVWRVCVINGNSDR